MERSRFWHRNNTSHLNDFHGRNHPEIEVLPSSISRLFSQLARSAGWSTLNTVWKNIYIWANQRRWNQWLLSAAARCFLYQCSARPHLATMFHSTTLLGPRRQKLWAKMHPRTQPWQHDIEDSYVTWMLLTVDLISRQDGWERENVEIDWSCRFTFTCKLS